MSPRHAVIVAAVVVVLLVAGCGRSGPTALPERPTDEAVSPAATAPAPSPSVTSSPTASATPTVTSTPTATPTPTPTALPAAVSGDPRAVVLSPPTPQSGAPCGVVDTLDFPIDPPDARGVAFGGRDFGVYRSRFNGYHTGEDWRGSMGRSSFGAPVYSIGHGTVTYAAPLGWGADQGVVIVRHVFADGSTVLSFYGHLDPPSVVLNAGACVARGDQVGQIGRPRTPPHLHFEIRSHMPNSPGPGYWSSAPALAGWQPPSQFIWNERIANAPGVQWTRPSGSWDTMGVGMLDDGTFVAIEDDQLLAVDVTDGGLRWSQPVTVTLRETMLDAGQPALYVANYVGDITAFRLPNPSDGEASGNPGLAVEKLWEVDLEPIGLVGLLPLPGGGLVASFRDRVVGVSPAGRALWEHETGWPVFDWVVLDDRLLFSTVGVEGSTWLVDRSGLLVASAPVGGRLAVAGDRIWVYGDDGIYWLEAETLSSELLYALPPGSPRLGDMVLLPDGGVLVAHTDRSDKRLIAMKPDGSLRWQRSIAAGLQGYGRLLVAGGRPYLLAQNDAASARDVSIFSVDLEAAELVRIFAGGSRGSLFDDQWAFALADGRILVDMAGIGMALLDPEAALQIIAGGE
jgi:murein DD-endopeptidase MepM/ murein hydrolase activator NlpD